MARTVLTKGLVFDGTGTPPVPGEVTLADDRVLSVTPVATATTTGPTA